MMTEPTPLSPAAQAVLNAFGTYPIRADHIAGDLIPALAAALRAAAKQEEALFDEYHNVVWAVRVECLLTIAAELDGGAQ